MRREIWKDIKGYEGRYQVSNWGNVRRLREDGTCNYLRGNTNGSGQFFVNLSFKGMYKSYAISHLVMNTFKDNPLKRKMIRHKDGILSNNSLTNLEWIEAREYEKKGYPLGTKHYRTKFKEKDILAIRKQYESGGFTLHALAAKYKVSYSNIYQIVNRTTWKHI